jgi:hypothetical protein
MCFKYSNVTKKSQVVLGYKLNTKFPIPIEISKKVLAWVKKKNYYLSRAPFIEVILV